jgi:hypothetical protein
LATQWRTPESAFKTAFLPGRCVDCDVICSPTEGQFFRVNCARPNTNSVLYTRTLPELDPWGWGGAFSVHFDFTVIPLGVGMAGEENK